jgi:hypothetical protein
MANAAMLTGSYPYHDVTRIYAGPRSGVAPTDDPDLHLLCDGARIEPEHGCDGWHSFA